MTVQHRDPLSWENVEPVEVIRLRCKTHTAAIRLAQVPEGWSWASDCSRLYGDVLGYTEPLGRRGGFIAPSRLAPTRDQALAAAIDKIRQRIPDRPVLDWLASLNPAQADLFGAPR